MEIWSASNFHLLVSASIDEFLTHSFNIYLLYSVVRKSILIFPTYLYPYECIDLLKYYFVGYNPLI